MDSSSDESDISEYDTDLGRYVRGGSSVMSSVVCVERLEMAFTLTVDQQDALSTGVLMSNACCSAEQFAAFKTRVMTERGLDDAGANVALMSFALACAHNGSSEKTSYPGEINGVLMNVLKQDCLKTCGTVRQFSTYLAKYVWNIMIRTNRPPSGWMRWGYPHATRFAAFDAFRGVTSQAALEPPEGLVREPSEAEVQANAVNGLQSIEGSRQREMYSTNGRLLAMQQLAASSGATPRLGY